MLSIFSTSRFAPFNIAAEEYILRSFKQDVFMLYINNPSIIVGRHQNTLAEINQDWVILKQIPVVRRLTGGGSVFHDPGNLNFSFLMHDAEETTRSFERYTRPVLDVLNDLGVNAILEGRNDLTIGGRKFSGNAKTNAFGKTLQHGTILFSSKIGDLSAALKVKPFKFNDKAVKSIRARVTNVSEHLLAPLALEDFVGLVRSKVHSLYPDIEEYSFCEADNAAIHTLVKEKYDTWEWNFGRSPNYNISHELRCNAGIIELYLQVDKGIIQEIKIFGDYFSSRETSELEKALTCVPHRREAISEVLQRMDYRSFFGDVDLENLLSAMF
ncbi:lipoate--protein ligase [Candidatus Cloacimonadota bacterium]|nr:lipoate--protein ligase [Candidatus Cloacimonadota bacterium]MDD3234889.1 lipoate--protein ligase [Candidatus Cloacimonadota bacterium]